MTQVCDFPSDNHKSLFVFQLSKRARRLGKADEISRLLSRTAFLAPTETLIGAPRVFLLLKVSRAPVCSWCSSRSKPTHSLMGVSQPLQSSYSLVENVKMRQAVRTPQHFCGCDAHVRTFRHYRVFYDILENGLPDGLRRASGGGCLFKRFDCSFRLLFAGNNMMPRFIFRSSSHITESCLEYISS